HRLIFRLIREGKIQGLRIDHPDGLYDPPEYLERLQRRCLIEKAKAFLPPAVLDREALDSMMMDILDRVEKEGQGKGRGSLPLYLIVEKILSRGERLPTAWPVHGTVGYEFAHVLNGLFIDATHAGAFDQIYSDFIGERLRFQDVVYERKKMVMNTTMASEINVLARRLNRLSEKDRLSRDFTLYSLRDAIREIIACFPVYRTYIGGKGVIGEEDRRHIETAIWKAKQRSPAVDISVFDYLKKVLLLQYPDYFGEEDRAELLTFVKRFQQTTGPVMAKGLEDTACYIYNRMISLNEVGGDLPAFGVSPVAFHEQNRQRREQWPYGMLTTSTHDTKRSEDVRARINVLSELPEEWRTRLRRWSEINETKKADCDGRPAPDFNEEYLLYQTLLGAWPFEKMEAEQYETFVERIEAYMAKATKEAKVNTSWISPNQAYDDAVTRFVRAILDRSASNRFLEDFLIFQRKVAHFGLLNSLSQLLLKIASPGVPDIYQGCDLWDFSLVDPDNRRPVDFARRAAFLRLLPQDPSGALLKELLENKTDGRIKLYITWKALALRKRRKTLFLCGEYLPLQEEGRRTGHLIAFGRRWKNRFVIAAVPRLLVSLTMGELIDPIGPIWEESWLRLPPGVSADLFQNVLTGEIVRAHPRQGGSVLALPEVFSIFPVALLIS
ncbi:MAG TPA: malto-oligosyltrehalose synthase, partial [Candidatus Manganitrophaceae bacterium]